MGNKKNRLKEVKRAIKRDAFKVKNATINEVRKIKEMIARFLSKFPQPPIKFPFTPSKNEKNGQPKEIKTSNNCNQAQNDAQKDEQTDTQNKINNSNQAEQHDNKQDNQNYSNQSNNDINRNNNNNKKQSIDGQNNNSQNENAQNENKRDKEQSQQGNAQGAQSNEQKFQGSEQGSQSVGQQPRGNGQGLKGEQEGEKEERKQNSDYDNVQNGGNEQQDIKEQSKSKQDNGNQQDSANKLGNNGQQPNQITQEEFDKMKESLLDAKRKREQQNNNERETANTDNQQRQINKATNEGGQEAKKNKEVAEQSPQVATQGSNDTQAVVQVVSASATDENVSEPLKNVTSLDMLDNILPNFSEEPVPFGNLNQDDEKVNDIIARNIIQKFVKMRFKSSNSQLNTRQIDTEKVSGVSKWDTMQVVKHKTTREYNKMLKDKYDYDYDSGKQEQIPFSIYLDLSISMNAHIPILTTLAMQFLKNDVCVIIGTNEEARLQINEIPQDMTKNEFAKLISSYNYTYNLSKTKNLKIERIDCNIGKYLTEKKAEKALIFSDYDPCRTICDLSQTKCCVYWFNFDGISREYLKDFKGVIRAVSKPNDILKVLTSFTSTNYNALTYKQTSTKSESAATQSKYNDYDDYDL